MSVSPEEAAQALDNNLRKYPWYVSVGVADDGRSTALYVYVKSRRHKELVYLAQGWMGYQVVIRPVGTIRPAVCKTIEALA
jgi:hypothetical protein